jgi:hypothetical protein
MEKILLKTYKNPKNCGGIGLGQREPTLRFLGQRYVFWANVKFFGPTLRFLGQRNKKLIYRDTIVTDRYQALPND